MYQYFWKMDKCPAKTAKDANCICWHDEGTGSFADRGVNDDKELWPKLEWRTKPIIQIQVTLPPVNLPVIGRAK